SGGSHLYTQSYVSDYYQESKVWDYTYEREPAIVQEIVYCAYGEKYSADRVAKWLQDNDPKPGFTEFTATNPMMIHVHAYSLADLWFMSKTQEECKSAFLDGIPAALATNSEELA